MYDDIPIETLPNLPPYDMFQHGMAHVYCDTSSQKEQTLDVNTHGL